MYLFFQEYKHGMHINRRYGNNNSGNYIYISDQNEDTLQTDIEGIPKTNVDATKINPYSSPYSKFHYRYIFMSNIPQT